MKFERTRRALARYHERRLLIDALWDDVKTNEDIERLGRREQAELLWVQRAFWHDTKPHNSLDHCRVADLAFLERLTSS